MTTYCRCAFFQRKNIRLATVIIAMAVSMTIALGSAPLWAADGASIARGGRLFDNWILENRDYLPSEIHPKYNVNQRSMHSVETSWRCVSCHGWDYKGRSGQGTGALNEVGDINPDRLKTILKDQNHGYDGRLLEGDFTDLAAYLAAIPTEMASYSDPGLRHLAINAPREADLYATVCANCHGADGHKITTMVPLGTFARRHPLETMHKIRNGHPAERMPPFRFLKADRLDDLFAHIQTLPGINLSASIARGGRLYDHWQKETKSRPPTSRHPAYPKEASQAAIPTANWRCKECHGWDYNGSDGVYGTGPHRTGIKGIRAMIGSDPEKIVELLMDSNHRYHGTRWFEAPLDMQDLTDLANFVALGQVDMSDYIDPRNGIAKGNPERHKDEFEVLCATCHGKDGKGLGTGNDIGKIARDNPWEALHKIRNGHPNEAMPALQILDMTVLVDILSYAQTLP